MSARISGVKNFESQKISFVRGFPFSHVQSASENGSIFFFSGTWVATEAVLDSLFGPIAAAILADIEPGKATAGALATVADGVPSAVFTTDIIPLEIPGPGAALASTAGFASFDSRSATRFSSCSTRSNSQRSRSVSPASGLFSIGFVTVGFESLPALLSSARPTSQTLELTNILNPNDNTRFTHLRIASLLPDFGQRICFRNGTYPVPQNVTR